MLGIIYKDFCCHKKELLMNLFASSFFVFTFFIIFPSFSEDFKDFYSVLFFLGATFTLYIWVAFIGTLFSNDEDEKYINYICAYHQEKKNIFAKYIEGIILLTLFYLFFTILFVISAAVYFNNDYSLFLVNPFFFLLIILVIGIFVLAIEFPFMVYFTTRYGGYFKIIAFGILFLLFVVIFLYASVQDLEEKIFIQVSKFLNDKSFKTMIYILFPFSIAFYFSLSYLSFFLFKKKNLD